MKTIYRLETIDGLRGVYDSMAVRSVGDELGIDLYYDTKRHPAPSSDPGLMDTWRRLDYQYDWADRDARKRCKVGSTCESCTCQGDDANVGTSAQQDEA